MIRAVGTLVATLLATGCSCRPDNSASVAEAEVGTPSTLVALGDSWSERAHCGFCRTFARLYADGIETVTDGPVEFKDLTGQAQPYFEQLGGGAESLLEALRREPASREEVSSGDLIM